jgi:hypothetical protein
MLRWNLPRRSSVVTSRLGAVRLAGALAIVPAATGESYLPPSSEYSRPGPARPISCTVAVLDPKVQPALTIAFAAM